MVFENLGESVNASADIIFAFLRKCHTERIPSRVIDVEGMAGNIDHFGLLNRFRQNGLAIEPLRQNDPEEQSAGRPGPLNARRHGLFEGGKHRLAFLFVEFTNSGQLPFDYTLAKALSHNALVKHAAAKVGGLFDEVKLFNDRFRRNNPSHTQASRKDL